MPATLRGLMRHENIETTMRYYVDLEADDVAEELWANHEAAIGNTLATLPHNNGEANRQKEGETSER